ncbi:O-linked N-acetylglucosamine transferase family protein [Pararhizobium sp. O133]|uniref:O-linked N-acetylglucosamine transferase, SPINDLY family protein n=1 Tax=Pararhizobium sp. O133 TaxID=3449278 RepID=UPI003F6892F3
MDGQALVAAQAAFERGDFVEALTILTPLLSDTMNPPARILLGETLARLGLLAEAAQIFEQAADGADSPCDSRFQKRAVMLYAEAGDDDRAQLLGIRLLPSLPEDAELAYALARSFRRSGDAALVDLVKNTLAGSDDPDHLKLAGDILNEEERNPLALTVFGKLAALYPDDPFTQFKFMSVARDFCDFAAIEKLETALGARLATGDLSALEGETAYSNLLRCGDERLNRSAMNNPGLTAPPSPAASRQRRTRPHGWVDKIRVGYLSNDFFSAHATMRLLRNVLEAHDASRFDITLFCYTPEHHTINEYDNRQRWGRVVSILGKTDAQAADIIRQKGIDILVDLKGHTGGSRSNILNQMPAPVQVAWLGFPGSGTHIDCDFVIGDRIVLPDSSRPFYHEKFCRLPESYQPNDPVHRALPPAASRRLLGLPEDRVVLAAFNAARKISLEVVDHWAEILRRADHAILWVMIDGALARSNFLAAFQARGIAADRIIFAQSAPYDAHIARLQAADIGLDTFPYNGHTTTSDKLWAGLPVVTFRGSNFASRVSESLLTTLGVLELVAPDADAFVDMAVALAENPSEVARLKDVISRRRFTAPLFDAERFCRHLESAYDTMVECAKAKLPPDHFDVAQLPPRTEAFSSRS